MPKFIDDQHVFNDGAGGIKLSIERHPSIFDGRRCLYIEQDGVRNHVATFTTPQDGYLCRLTIHNNGINGLTGFEAGPNNSIKVEVPT